MHKSVYEGLNGLESCIENDPNETSYKFRATELSDNK